jgi:hypothetical protein
MVEFREDLFVMNDNDKRKFDKTKVVTCSAKISLMNQEIPEGEFNFDSYEKDGGCYIKQGVGIHYYVNECDLTEVIPPVKKV